MEDIQGKPLERGAMYACAFMQEEGDGTPYVTHGQLVRFIGYDGTRVVFADADEWDEANPDFDELERQSAPVVDPASKGWPEFA